MKLVLLFSYFPILSLPSLFPLVPPLVQMM
jgi:hypothetical protein